MKIGTIAKILLETGETVHDAENIEIQNWTNSLTDGQVNSLWAHASRKGLRTYKENGARFIAKSALEKLAH
jgi:hypothetical protein